MSTGYVYQNLLMYSKFRGVSLDLKVNFTVYKILNLEYNLETAYLWHQFWPEWLVSRNSNMHDNYIYKHDQVIYTGLYLKLLSTKYNLQPYWNIGVSLRLYLWPYKNTWSWLEDPFFPIYETSFGFRYSLNESLFLRFGLSLGASIDALYAEFSLLSKIKIGIGKRF